MKTLVKIFSVIVVLALVAGCASNVVFVPKIPPHAQAKLLDYHEQPENKVFVIAVNPGGDYAFGYDYGKPTLKEAAKVAVEKCDANRESQGVVAKAYIYAINDKVVYEEMIRADAEAKNKSGEQAQVDEVERQEETGEADQPAE